MPAGCVGARSAASPLPGGAWGPRRVSRCCAPVAVRLPGPGDAARGALTAPGLGWLLDLGAACNSLGLICCFFFFPARSAKRSQKWQLHGSAGLVPLAAVGDKWENARGRREGGVSGAWRQRPRPCPKSSSCSVALPAPFQGALPVSARLHPPGVPVTQHYLSPPPPTPRRGEELTACFHRFCSCGNLGLMRGWPGAVLHPPPSPRAPSFYNQRG